MKFINQIKIKNLSHNLNKCISNRHDVDHLFHCISRHHCASRHRVVELKVTCIVKFRKQWHLLGKNIVGLKIQANV